MTLALDRIAIFDLLFDACGTVAPGLDLPLARDLDGSLAFLPGCGLLLQLLASIRLLQDHARADEGVCTHLILFQHLSQPLADFGLGHVVNLLCDIRPRDNSLLDETLWP